MLTTILLLITAAPSEWTCLPHLYADGYSCDCGCGIDDPDCGATPVAQALCANNYCPEGRVPLDGAVSQCKPNECGDGFVGKPEACDDGDGPGCDGECLVITDGYRCSGLGAGCSVPGCGDGFVDRELGESCDDRNEDAGDGCNGCEAEPGWVCRFFGGCYPTTCGDGVIDFDWETQTGESCEDADVLTGDGCDAYCRAEPGWVCNWESCYEVVCGDGFVSRGDFGGGEQCDGGNDDPGDGCDENCQIEPGWWCDDFSGCQEVACGNLVISPDENCDDGNDDPGDGCSERCQSEPGWSCQYRPGACHEVVCGDGAVESDDSGTVFEQCDDRNVESGDGCSDGCQTEPGFVCNELGCRPIVCGDGIVDGGNGGGPGGPKGGEDGGAPAEAADKVIIIPPGGEDPPLAEQCDDHNDAPGDGCDDRCQVEEGWVCEVPGEACEQPVCGDSQLTGVETCDDGDTEDGDGCSGKCQREPNWICREIGKPCEPMPTAWVCSLFVYAADDGCDCGCGAPDPDCPSPLEWMACDYNHCLEGAPWPDVADPTGCSATPPPPVEPEPEATPEEAPEAEPEPGPEAPVETAAEVADDVSVGGGKSDGDCNAGGGASLIGLVVLLLGRRRRAAEKRV